LINNEYKRITNMKNEIVLITLNVRIDIEGTIEKLAKSIKKKNLLVVIELK